MLYHNTYNANTREENKEPLLRDIVRNEESFEAYFKNNFKSLCYYCHLKFSLDLEMAKETVHMAFIKLWNNREKLPGHVSAGIYLQKIITNTYLDILKHEKVKRKHEAYILKTSSETVHDSGFESLDYKELSAEIHKAVSELPEHMRKIFELNRYEGLKHAEISSQLGISPKTVETQMSRALARLRQKLSRYLPFI